MITIDFTFLTFSSASLRESRMDNHKIASCCDLKMMKNMLKLQMFISIHNNKLWGASEEL